MSGATFVYDIGQSKIVREFGASGFDFIEFSPDARFFVDTNFHDDVKVEIWNIKSGQRVRRFDFTARAVVWLNGKTLLAGDENGVRPLRVK